MKVWQKKLVERDVKPRENSNLSMTSHLFSLGTTEFFDWAENLVEMREKHAPNLTIFAPFSLRRIRVSFELSLDFFFIFYFNCKQSF